MTTRTGLEPTPQNIRRTRLSLRLSETAAGEVIYVSRESWRLYEKGTTKIKLGLWELFLIKTGRLWLHPPIPKPVSPRQRPGRIENLRPFSATTQGQE